MTYCLRHIRDRLITLSELNPEIPVSEVAKRFGCSGYVVESVPLALYGAQQMQRIDFETMLRQIIAAGGDTDTNASIAGQIVGAWLGMKRLPTHLVDRLPDRLIIQLAAELFAAMVARKLDRD